MGASREERCSHVWSRGDGEGPRQDLNDDGVDGTLIDEMLAMSVEDRLRQNDRMLATVFQLRDAVTRAGG
ncbi:MAG TPA: hypothetical protein VFH68_20925 [Polyangia bacterium]|jgi:hypothetical protein|nr:hypothetical protein [Polyangia bacterium]